MTTITVLSKYELKSILIKHEKWLRGDQTGKQADLSFTYLRYADLQNANLQEANLRYSFLVDANLENANLQKANLEGVVLTDANLKNTDLRSVDLTNVNLSKVDLTNAILDIHIKNMKINDDFYVIDYDGYLKNTDKKIKNKTENNAKTYFKQNYFYKFVVKKNGKLFSFVNTDFMYKINEKVSALKDEKNNGGLYFLQKERIEYAKPKHFFQFVASFHDEIDGVSLIEVTIDPLDFIKAYNGVIEAKSCYVLREVPKEEWKEWIK